MVKQLVIIAAILALALGYPANLQAEEHDIVEDPTSGQQYYLIPVDTVEEPTLVRNRRQTVGGGIDNKGFDVSGGGTIFESHAHKVDGTANVGKTFGGPWSKGGTLDYLHKPSNSGASVTATHTPGWGTDVAAQAKYNFYNSPNGRTTAGVSGNYERHFGGPFGASKPNYGALLNFNHRF